MGSGMNLEQAKELASKRTYRWAVENIVTGKGIKYRKATMIKLRELARIADELDCNDVPHLEMCKRCEHWKITCSVFNEICTYKPKIERTYK